MAAIKRKKRKAVKKRTRKRLTRKRTPKKRVAKKKAQKKAIAKEVLGQIVGAVTHYFPRVRAAAIKLKAPLNMGDNVRIKGHTTDFTQNVGSIQIDRQPITTGKRGQEIGLLVGSRVRRRDIVYKI